MSAFRRDRLEDQFKKTARHLYGAVEELDVLIRYYDMSDHPQKQARIAALKAKISALTDIKVNSKAYPWSED